MIEDPATITMSGALVTAIAVLWRDLISTKKQSEDRYVECSQQHEQTHKDLLKMTEQVGELRGEVHLAKEIIPELRELSSLLKGNVSEQYEEET